MTRPIAIGLSPNTNRADYVAALKTVLSPWIWKKGQAIDLVKQWFREYFGVETVLTFNAGRSALFTLLQIFGIGEGDEVMVQAYTCVAVPNSVIWAGSRPIYVDIDSTLNFDVADAEKKRTPKTRAVIVQHTFGIPANMDAIIAFCQKHQLILIEDCAHSLGATYKEKLLGTFGDAAFFSFGRDKIVSSVFGGAAIINPTFVTASTFTKVTVDKSEGKQKLEKYTALAMPSYFWILQQLLHPVVMSVALPLYDVFGIGKVVIWLFQRLHLLSFPVYPEEKKSRQPHDFPKLFPNALAQLLLVQLTKLEVMNKHRAEIAQYYYQTFTQKKYRLPDKQSGAVYLRFTLLTSKADQVRFVAKKKGIILGNWYTHIIDPKGVNYSTVFYEQGSCPKSEKAARESINLPTYQSLTTNQSKQITQIVLQLHEE